MRIKQISVSGLFGIFDHVIPLNMEERITIIHSLNGFGKTSILRMLNGLFNSQYSVFRDIPFNKFRVEFNNGSCVEVVKNYTIEKAKKSEEISCDFYEPDLDKQTVVIMDKEAFLIREPIDTSKLLFSLDDVLQLQELESKSKALRYSSNSETLSSVDISKKMGERLDEPPWLKKIKSDIDVRLIESQRLLNVVSERSSKLPMLPTVSAYSDEIAQLIQSKLAEYGAISQSLDRTFPARVVQQNQSSGLEDEELRLQLDKLEENRSRLVELGLLDKDNNSDFQIQSQDHIDPSTINVLSVYAQDIEKKLSVFSEIANKIELLRKIINSKFAYSYKEMNFNKKKGFVFKTLSTSGTDNISPKDLSSGEQHELVLFYELLFKVEPNSLVLIDEPELSLHVAWQAQFLRDLQEIIKLTDLDVLLATHSPDIIQGRWDLTKELKGPAR